MTSITSKAKFRQRVIRYSEKHGVTAASIRHRVTRKAVYDWKKKYDGHWKSLCEGSDRPHSHPNQHTAEENALIIRYYVRNKEDKMVLWDKIRKCGYTRPYKSMVRALKRLVIEDEKTKRSKYNPKPYKRADYPGQKVQVDVKFVPSYCEENEIIYHRIQVATPRHNGKVERQHRLDEQRFYSKMRMYDLAEGRKQLAKYNKLSNNIPKCCLNYRSPNEVLEDYLGVM